MEFSESASENAHEQGRFPLASQIQRLAVAEFGSASLHRSAVRPCTAGMSDLVRHSQAQAFAAAMMGEELIRGAGLEQSACGVPRLFLHRH